MNWENFSGWHLVLPPSRPSVFELDRARAILCQRDRTTPIAVLGATPEYRDLLGRMGFTSVSVIDKNPSYLVGQSDFCPNARNENVIVQDWCAALSERAESFDIVFSHLTSGNIPYSLRQAFYEIISESLTRDGILVDTILTHSLGFHSAPRLIERFANCTVSLESVNRFNCEFVFCSSLIEQEGLVRPAASYAFAKSYTRSPTIHRLVDLCGRITPDDAVWFYGRPWPTELAIIEKYLRVVECFDQMPYGPYHGNSFQFIMKKA